MACPQDVFKPLQSRAYQLEMFNHSLNANTIVVMGTGTGKTHVASLRIDVELQRSPSKQVWFTAPNAGLVDQQLRFLTSQLPGYCMKSLTGRDNVDRWGSAAIWEMVLRDVNVIVATPQILFDALHNAYVKLQNISLLVFDEAHHCQANSPSALIMQTFYHPQKGVQNLPHVLGLTASPCNSDKSLSVKQLETNLDATCRTPTISIEQYAQHYHRAALVKRIFTNIPRKYSSLLHLLGSIVVTTEMHEDPYYKSLLSADAEGDLGAKAKLQKYRKRGQTPALSDLRRFLGNAEHLHEALGTWASDLYITACLSEWRKSTREINEYHDSHSSRDHLFIDQRLSPLYNIAKVSAAPTHTQVSSKAVDLIEFLVSEYQKDVAIIVFVERRTAAWALCRLLQAHQVLKQYHVFSCVGLSAGKAARLYEAWATKEQEMDFRGFREGSKNLCVATSVAEEGYDVQAVNIVVRFDDPKQSRSYLQSRGRARRKDSRIVYFQDSNSGPDKYKLWKQFESEMEEYYLQEERELHNKLDIEKSIEDGDESYQVQHTGARLDLNVSVSRLAHFCAKVPIPSDPVYMFDGESGKDVSAKVLLPSSVPPALREANSCRTWRSQKMARRDAAFHAMKALHIAGLVNDHLMPFEEEDISEPLLHEKKLRDVPPEQQIWLASNSEARTFAYRIEILREQSKCLSMVMILSTSLQHTLRFPLSESSLKHIEVNVVPLGQVDGCDVDHAGDVTQLLFEAAFQAGSASSSLIDPRRLSCKLVPEFNDTQLGEESSRLTDFLRHHDWLLNLQPLLIWKKTRPRPYVWYPPHVIRRNPKDKTVLMAKQVRKLQVFTQTLNGATGEANTPQEKEILLEECEARGIATVYGPVVLLLPTILHFMAAAIRAQIANQTILSSIEFSSMEYINPALIANSASGTYNYERLEFLGDACLKYLTSVQIFFDHPSAPEGILTRKTQEIIGNTRLERAINDVGLAPFITSEKPTQKHWQLPKVVDNSKSLETRNVLSKTLADVVESILGAAFLDGTKSGKGIARCLAALRLFIPDIPWRLPEFHIERIHKQPTQDPQQSLLQRLTKQMLGCNFESPTLLAEALTHSTDVVTQPALDRLEFLGDAILDQIIKVKLFEYDDLDANRLTLCRHALVSHVFLAYLAFSVHHDQASQHVLVEQNGDTRSITSTKRVGLTDLIKFREPSQRDRIVTSKTKCDDVRDTIEFEMKAGRFPWTLLRSLNAPKVCSDIIESLLAALYLGSQGCFSRCEELLDRLGMIDLLRRMATNSNFEVRTPGARLRELCAERKITVNIKSRYERDRDVSRYIGEVCLEGNVCITRMASCLQEAESLVAEAALDFLTMLQRSCHATPEHKTDGMKIDTDIDIVMSELLIPDDGGEITSTKPHS